MSILRSTLPDLTLNIDEWRELLFRGYISWYGPKPLFLHYCGGARVNADDEREFSPVNLIPGGTLSI